MFARHLALPPVITYTDSMPRFDAIFMDFYGTISAGDREAVEGTCARIVETLGLALTPGEMAVVWGEEFFRTVEGSNHHAFRTLYECELISLRVTLAAMGIDADPRPFVAELEEYWVNPPVYADALAFLRGNKLPVCVISNADTVPLMGAIARHGLSFDAVVSSEEARCYKPEGAIFQRAAKLLGVDPRRCIHVGDSLHSDVHGAKQAGITTAWLQRVSRIHDIGTAEADHVIADLSEMARLLEL